MHIFAYKIFVLGVGAVTKPVSLATRYREHWIKADPPKKGKKG